MAAAHARDEPGADALGQHHRCEPARWHHGRRQAEIAARVHARKGRPPPRRRELTAAARGAPRRAGPATSRHVHAPTRDPRISSRPQRVPKIQLLLEKKGLHETTTYVRRAPPRLPARAPPAPLPTAPAPRSFVNKKNEHGKVQARLLAVTNAAVYNLTPNPSKEKARGGPRTRRFAAHPLLRPATPSCGRCSHASPAASRPPPRARRT